MMVSDPSANVGYYYVEQTEQDPHKPGGYLQAGQTLESLLCV